MLAMSLTEWNSKVTSRGRPLIDPCTVQSTCQNVLEQNINKMDVHDFDASVEKSTMNGKQ